MSPSINSIKYSANTRRLKVLDIFVNHIGDAQAQPSGCTNPILDWCKHNDQNIKEVEREKAKRIEFHVIHI